MKPQPSWIAAAVLVVAAGACGPFCGNGKLNFSNAQIRPAAFACPIGVTDYQYEVRVSVEADNQTGGNVTIRSVSDTVVVTKVAGNWHGTVGDRSGASNLVFSPRSIDSGSKVTINLTMPWTCTNYGGDPNVDTHADFSVVMTIVTSAGTYQVNLPSHRMKLPG